MIIFSIFRVEAVLLLDIEAIDETELNKIKLYEIVRDLKNAIYRNTEPIVIDKRLGRHFKILDGKHRIYAARKRNQRLIPAIVIY
jgi:ParB-like chromosome segregation protein Spo0J